jgi:MFS family permease
MANNVPQLILLYTLLSCIISGVSPIAIMYTVECYKHRSWEGGIAKYNAITTIGVTLGLVTFSVAAQFYKTNTLFYISAATCIIGALLFWWTAKEPEITLERNHFTIQITHNLERFLSANSILHYFKIPRINIPKNLRQLKPIQMLFLASFVHWFGMSMAWLGQTPLIKILGLSDSLILTINIVSNLATALAFIWIARRAKSPNKSSINRILVVRCGLVLSWAALPIIFFHSVIIVFTFSLILNILTSMLYAMIWLPLSTFAISQTPADRRGGVQGELLAAIGVANVFGSFFGGLVTEAFGYSIGFILASIIVMFSIPIFSRIDI